jgi:hypothetical protein
VKLEVVRGQVYYGNRPAANPGDVIDLPDASAERLIALGVAKKPGVPAPAKPEPDPPAEAKPHEAEGGASPKPEKPKK